MVLEDITQLSQVSLGPSRQPLDSPLLAGSENFSVVRKYEARRDSSKLDQDSVGKFSKKSIFSDHEEAALKKVGDKNREMEREIGLVKEILGLGSLVVQLYGD